MFSPVPFFFAWKAGTYMIKRFVCVLLFGLLLCLCACGSGGTAESTTEYVLDAQQLLNAEEIRQHDCEIHGHVYSQATCVQKAACYYCGQETGAFGSHDWMRATCMRKATCTVCGAEQGDFGSHLFTKATCAAPSSCAVCGTKTGSALAHSFKAATCVTPSICTGCMRKQGKALGHTWTGGSCTVGRTCTRCKRQEAAPGHKMSKGSCTQDAVCSVCKYTEKAKGHQFNNGVCTVCGKTLTQASQDDAARATTAVVTETETTAPPLDLDALQSYADTLEALLNQAHEEADDAIDAPAETQKTLAASAVGHLAQAVEVINDAIAHCGEDARTKTLSEKLTAVKNAIRKSAAIQNFYDSSFLQTMITVRADSTAGLDALKAYKTALRSLEP